MDRDAIFLHLEVRAPDRLIYKLHQLFLARGRKCPTSRAKESKKREDLGEICVIEDSVKRARQEKRDSGFAKAGKIHCPVKKDNRKSKSKSDEANLTENEFPIRTKKTRRQPSSTSNSAAFQA